MYILAFDIGTSAIKSSLVSQKGRIIDSVSYRYEVINPARKWVEQNPELWWQGACYTTGELLERNPGARKQIAVIGVCGHMLGCIPVDSTGRALRSAMIHADSRASAEADAVCKTVGHDNFYRRTGCIPSAQSTLAKILWLKRNDPEVYEKTVRFLQSKDYLAAQMTGNIDTTDFSDASHAQLIDIHTKAYITDIFAEFGLDPLKFPAIHKGIDVIGRVSKTAGQEMGIPDGIPVIAGGGDGACANVGAGITTNRKDLYCCIGTTAWIAYSTALPVIDNQGRVFDIMSLDGESFGVFGTMQAAGKSIDWARRLLNIESNAVFDLEAAAVPPGSDGLIFVPYLEGERSPIFDPNARGIFFNIDSHHQRAHFARSVLEGVSYALRSILDVYRESMPISELRLIGGGANSKLWCQILADVCGITIRTTDTHTDSVTSLGVALAAGVSAGMFENLDEAASVVATVEKTEPLKENISVYNRLFDTYTRLYQQVKSLYDPA